MFLVLMFLVLMFLVLNVSCSYVSCSYVSWSSSVFVFALVFVLVFVIIVVLIIVIVLVLVLFLVLVIALVVVIVLALIVIIQPPPLSWQTFPVSQHERRLLLTKLEPMTDKTKEPRDDIRVACTRIVTQLQKQVQYWSV